MRPYEIVSCHTRLSPNWVKTKYSLYILLSPKWIRKDKWYYIQYSPSDKDTLSAKNNSVFIREVSFGERGY